jgi:hypothetical protein
MVELGSPSGFLRKAPPDELAQHDCNDAEGTADQYVCYALLRNPASTAAKVAARAIKKQREPKPTT